MTDNKKELDEFETRLRTMTDRPDIKIFLSMIDGMSTHAKYDALEKQKRVMRIGEILGQGLQHILSSEKSKQLFLEELKKRSGTPS